MNSERLLVGWKEIMAAFGVRSLKTMKKKVKKYGIPIVTIAQKPTIYLHQVKEWGGNEKKTGGRAPNILRRFYKDDRFIDIKGIFGQNL